MVGRIRCEFCDNPIYIKDVEHQYEYKCPRCENTIYRPGASKGIVTLLSIGTTLILFWSLFTPLLSVNIIGDIRLSIYDTLIFLFERDILSGIFLSLTIIVIPILMNIITLMIIYHKAFNINFRFLKKIVGFYLFIKEWNMIEVYFVGLLISMVKLFELADVEILIGFWVNTIYVILLYINLMVFNPLDFANIKKIKSVNANMSMMVIIFLLVALIFIPPSNMLPIMPTYKYSVTYDKTIIDGITAFWEEGDVIIPFIIFFASICIPVLKIVGLSVMLIMAKYKLWLQHRKFA
ncbi:MAG TPA: hypothetical protein ENK66_07455, partial [Arcobacter sp.]|nr:hypothetical protein [Arcobacter sp.]